MYDPPMRADVYVREVLDKCEALKKARLWLSEPHMRPHAWIRNFDEVDRPTAALLLDSFTFYSDKMTDRLLVGSYDSLADGLPKGPSAPDALTLMAALDDAVFTRIEGETPRPTDSGNLFCRKARQVLGIPDDRFLEPHVAITHAAKGCPVVFLDDFVGSGDQFLKTWSRKYATNSPQSFVEACSLNQFVAVYVTLVATDYGLQRIRQNAPNLAITVAHELSESDTARCLSASPSLPIQDVQLAVKALLHKYASRLSPPPDISQDPSYVRYGYKERALLFAFEHSVPDATLPIFWSPGQNWTQLLERR